MNDAAVAVNDAYGTDEDSALTIAATGILGNDTDAEGDTLTAVLVNNVSHGTLTLNSNGSFTYTPAANFNGTDSFSYKANDGTVNSSIVTVTLTVNPVNDAPTAVNDAHSTNEGSALTVPASGVLGNDTDTEGKPLTAVLVNNVSHGTLTLNANGSFTYTPAANFNGTDSFSYKANDGTADSSAATVTITVNPLPTIASIDTTEGQRGKNLTITISGSNFTGVTAVSFGSGIEVSFTPDSATQITVEITITEDAEIGTRDVSVTTPAGTRTFADAFSVENSPSKGIGAWVWGLVVLGAIALMAAAIVIWRKRSTQQ